MDVLISSVSQTAPDGLPCAEPGGSAVCKRRTSSSPWKRRRSPPPVQGLGPGSSGFLVRFSTGPCTQQVLESLSGGRETPRVLRGLRHLRSARPPPCEMSAWSLSFFTGLGSRLQNGKCTLLGYEGAGVRGLELSAPLPVCPP